MASSAVPPRRDGHPFPRIIGAAALLVAACASEAGQVDVTGTGPGDVRFVLLGGDGARPCIDRLTVTAAADPDGPPLWRAVAADPAKCATRLRYGEPGADFGQEAGPAPLRPGGSYRVRASGTGFSVVRDFEVQAGGVRAATLDGGTP